MAIHSANSKQKIRTGCKDYTPFTLNGSLSGEHVSEYGGSMGQLPQWARTLLQDQAMESRGAYVVYSYGTPIAWSTEPHGWVVPNTKYSVTTTNHQTVVRSIVGSLYGTYAEPTA